jgi:hypothetical protein
MIFSADETTDIGYESGTPVSPDYNVHSSKFTGKIHWVQLDAGVDDTTTSSIRRSAFASPWRGSRTCRWRWPM